MVLFLCEMLLWKKNKRMNAKREKMRSRQRKRENKKEQSIE